MDVEKLKICFNEKFSPSTICFLIIIHFMQNYQQKQQKGGGLEEEFLKLPVLKFFFDHHHHPYIKPNKRPFRKLIFLTKDKETIIIMLTDKILNNNISIKSL